MDDEHYIDGDHNGGVFNHFNHNSYGYCYQNPINLIDPNGKQVPPTYGMEYSLAKTPEDFKRIQNRKNAEAAGTLAGVAFWAGAYALATYGLRAIGAFFANEAKDELLSYATGGAYDYIDISKLGKNLISKGIDRIKKHLSKLDHDVANDVMIDRLDKISKGKLKPTEQDNNFFTHELIEKDLVDKGMKQEKAHIETLKKQGIKYEKGYEKKIYTEEALKKGDEALKKDVEVSKKIK